MDSADRPGVVGSGSLQADGLDFWATPPIQTKIVRVTDGGISKVRLYGPDLPVTSLGINAPETRPVPPISLGTLCLSLKHSKVTKSWWAARPPIWQMALLRQTDRDGLLRYVWLKHGKMLNPVLVPGGYYRTAVTPP